ncbi:MAG: hypothetical protein DI566_05035 [Microbacterium sp.]|nr:MAG: hypothetical protein DI566_05035 [Microbacterium sp.]
MALDIEQVVEVDPREVRSTGLIVATVLTTLATVGLIWLAAVPFGSGVCPAVDPAPLNCSPAQRAGSGLVATICVTVVGALNVALGLWGGRRARPIVIAGLVVLAVAPFVSYAAVAFSSGFQIR